MFDIIEKYWYNIENLLIAAGQDDKIIMKGFLYMGIKYIFEVQDEFDFPGN